VKKNTIMRQIGSECGAALIMVMFITVLVLTATIAMLTAVGAGARETTDALSETKAYYAAESGLQSTINILRNDPSATYGWAVSHSNLSPKLTYATVNGVSQVSVDSQTGYSINVSNPDDVSFVTFYTDAKFLYTTNVTGWTIYNSGKKVCIPDCPVVSPPANRTEVTYTDAGSTTYGFSGTNPSLGTFTVTKYGTGAVIANAINFQIDYKMTSPRTATRTIRGSINTSSATQPVSISFQTQEYVLVGSSIELCSGTSSTGSGLDKCPTVSYALATGSPATQSGQLYADITPIEPYRLVVTSTGYGPNGAKKNLEGIIQKNFLNDLPSTSGLSMVGPGAGLHFEPGSGNPTYCGVDPGIQPGQTIPNNPTCTINPNQPTGPAIGVSDQSGLDHITSAAGNTQIVPPPAIITDAPDWQRTPKDMNDFVSQLRQTAITSGRYLPDTAGVTSLQNVNNAVPYINASEYSTGQHVTFCEGDCSVGPLSGGGILVITGNFEYNGNFNFRGLILVVGPPGTGVTRTGAGSGVILGNMVIAPYNPNNLAAGFGSPSFSTNGGGTSDLMFSGLSLDFDGTSAISNFMLGVAEK
jgi:Tfp pilus assembly protein PilX